MTTTIELRFPLGRYHATPWGRHPNEGDVEWPPSPWRLLRALFAVWKERAPDLEPEVVVGTLTTLTGPPSYLLPPSRRAHSRHWMPTSTHRSDPRGYDKSLILDGFVAVDPDEPLLVTWPVDLESEQRSVLEVLLSRLTYLGRAESLVEARLAEGHPEPEERQRCTPLVAGQGSVAEDPLELLVPQDTITIDELTATTASLQKRRLSTPPGTRPVFYEPPSQSSTERRRPRRPASPEVTAVQWRIRAPALPPRFGTVAAGHLAREQVLGKWAVKTDAEHSPMLSGTTKDRERLEQDHAHAHWLAFDLDGDRRLDRLIVWAPGGFNPKEVATLAAMPNIGAPGWLDDFRDVELGLEYAGPVEGLPEEIVGPARVWVSVTPFAPPHHPKKRDREGEGWERFVRDQVRLCLGWRGHPEPSRVQIVPGEPWLKYRRYRPKKEQLADARRAVGVRIEFKDAIRGPLALGQLSHFGLGLFTLSDFVD